MRRCDEIQVVNRRAGKRKKAAPEVRLRHWILDENRGGNPFDNKCVTK
jgi:hypothetical protein